LAEDHSFSARSTKYAAAWSTAYCGRLLTRRLKAAYSMRKYSPKFECVTLLAAEGTTPEVGVNVYCPAVGRAGETPEFQHHRALRFLYNTILPVQGRRRPRSAPPLRRERNGVTCPLGTASPIHSEFRDQDDIPRSPPRPCLPRSFRGGDKDPPPPQELARSSRKFNSANPDAGCPGPPDLGLPSVVIHLPQRFGVIEQTAAYPTATGQGAHRNAWKSLPDHDPPGPPRVIYTKTSYLAPRSSSFT